MIVPVTAYISSKDRYYTTLPTAISSIIMQTVTPEKIVVFLDGEHVDLRQNSVYQNLLALIEEKGMKWEIIFGLKKGQVHNHHYMSQNATTEFIWRLDDDNIAESNVLETLLKHMNDKKIGAVASLVIDPKMCQMLPPNASNNIKDIFGAPNIQWFKHPTNEIKEVEHLYSSFLYRKIAGDHGYCLDLSPVGHREETLFSHEMFRKGWKLLVNPSVVSWHVREPTNGIRSYNNPEFFEHDEKIFQNKLKGWNLEAQKIKLIILDCGIGDHWCFKNILPEIREKHKDKKIVLAVCYPAVFSDESDVKIISIAEAKQLVGDIDKYNVYRLGWEKSWTGSLMDLYKELYI